MEETARAPLQKPFVETELDANSRFLFKLFRRYYRGFKPDMPDRFTKKEYGFIPFGKTMQRHMAFTTPEDLKTFMFSKVPAHSYYSTAYYRHPSRPLMEDKEWMGAELIFDLDADAFQQVMNLNLTGTLIPTQVFLKPMARQKHGAVVNFSSMSAFRPLTRVAGYGVAKAGVSNFTAYMATEVAKKFSPDIRVNAIAPGFFLTEQNRTLLTNEDGSWTERGHDIIRQTPMNRMGNPDDLFGTIHYLISDASRFVTGTVAVVDGGFNVFSI